MSADDQTDPTIPIDPTAEETSMSSHDQPERASAWTTDTSADASTDTSADTSTDTPGRHPGRRHRLHRHKRHDRTGPCARTRPLPSGTPVTTIPFPRTLDEPRGVRVGTVVWGLVVAAVAIGLIAIGNGAVFDCQLATIVAGRAAQASRSWSAPCSAPRAGARAESCARAAAGRRARHDPGTKGGSRARRRPPLCQVGTRRRGPTVRRPLLSGGRGDRQPPARRPWPRRARRAPSRTGCSARPCPSRRRRRRRRRPR